MSVEIHLKPMYRNPLTRISRISIEQIKSPYAVTDYPELLSSSSPPADLPQHEILMTSAQPRKTTPSSPLTLSGKQKSKFRRNRSIGATLLTEMGGSLIHFERYPSTAVVKHASYSSLALKKRCVHSTILVSDAGEWGITSFHTCSSLPRVVGFHLGQRYDKMMILA